MTLLLLLKPYQFFDRGGIDLKKDKTGINKREDQDKAIFPAVDRLIQAKETEDEQIMIALVNYLLDD